MVFFRRPKYDGNEPAFTKCHYSLVTDWVGTRAVVSEELFNKRCTEFVIVSPVCRSQGVEKRFLTAQERSPPMNGMVTANQDYPMAGMHTPGQSSTSIYSNVNLPLSDLSTTMTPLNSTSQFMVFRVGLMCLSSICISFCLLSVINLS